MGIITVCLVAPIQTTLLPTYGVTRTTKTTTAIPITMTTSAIPIETNITEASSGLITTKSIIKPSSETTNTTEEIFTTNTTKAITREKSKVNSS